jgi:hypothetical protein
LRGKAHAALLRRVVLEGLSQTFPRFVPDRAFTPRPTMLVTRAEEWWVEVESLEDAEALLAAR